MTAPGALHSDHVNYLIFRYLQEHGHEDTARSFYRDWHRPRQFRDPEDYAFTRHVARFELISVIQDGLRHDEMQNRVGGTLRHAWSTVDPRRPVDGDEEAALNGSRPSSSGKRKSVGTGPVAEAYAPAVKRQRISSMPEVQTNGHRDAMDIDARSSSVEEEDVEEAVSPALGSDTATDAPTRYDSVATQTEVLNGQKIPPNRIRQHVMVLDVSKDTSKIYHAAWSPNTDVNTKNTLFVSGDSLCRMYRTPDHIDDSTSITTFEHMDEPAVSEGCFVTAMAWHPAGRILTCAIDTTDVSQSGKKATSQRIISIGADIGTYTHFPNTELLQPPGIILSISYSPSGKYLMIVRTNLDRGAVEIWPSLDNKLPDMPSTQPLAWKIFEHSLSHAAWTNEQQVIACTHHEQAWVLRLPEIFSNTQTFTEQTIAEHNLKSSTIVLPARGEVDATYHGDDTHGIDIFVVRPFDQTTAEDALVVFDSSLYDTDAYLKVQKTFNLHWSFLAAAVQPISHESAPDSVRNYGPARLLAVLFQHGSCQLYQLERDSNGIICKPLFSEGGSTFKISHGNAVAMAWSPDGKYLALASKALVQVWHIISTSEPLDKRPILTWRASTPFMDDVEDLNGSEQNASKPVCLTWDAESRKICYAVDSKVAIIECETTISHPVVNGNT